MKRRGFSHLLALIVTLLALSSVVQAQEKMTSAQFRELASSPGDSTPLDPKLLAMGPLWTNAAITVVLKYADGKTSKEEITGTNKTVKGRYIVSTVNSELYKQPISSVVAYDEKAGSYKVWGLFGETLTEGIMVYDLDKKIFSSYSIYGDGFLELGVNSYSDTNMSSHTVILKNGVLVCTRDVTVVPAKPASK